MKKGVEAITGKTEIPAGAWGSWEVSKWYESTPVEDRNEDLVKWVAFNITTGEPEQILEKDLGHFCFGEGAIGCKFLLVAYMYEPELSTGIEVTVLPAEEPKILSLKVSDVNDKPFTTAVAYGQVVNIHVNTSGMVGHHLDICLWEDDAKGSGHSIENEKNFIEKKIAVVGSKGVAHCQFKMNRNFAITANEYLATNDKSEGSTHEYYFTAYALGMLTLEAHKNLLLKNPDYKYKPEAERKKETEDHLKGKTKPKDPLPKVKKKVTIQESKVKEAEKKEDKTTPWRPTPEIKKGINSIYIRDQQGKAITGVFSDKNLRVYIISHGVIGKKMKLKIYEQDVTKNEFIVGSEEFTITGDKCYIPVTLSQIPRDLGGYYFEGEAQELFFDIEFIETHTHLTSTIVNVDTKILSPDKPTNVSKIFVEMPDEKKKKDDKKTCPNCDKDITIEEIKKICVNSKGKCLIENDAMIISALPHLNTYRKKVKINTCVRKAHFLAQISQESKFYSLQENFNWYWKSLIPTFSSYFKQFDTFDKKEIEAKKLGRANIEKKPGLSIDEQMKLANAIYGKTHPNGKSHTDSNDGWRYSGKGFKQITWETNYESLQKYFNLNMKVDGEADVIWVGGDNPYKLKNNAKDAITSALAFWGKNNINGVADENSAKAVKAVTGLINASKDADIVKPRIFFYEKAVEVLKVNKCKPIKENPNEFSTYDGNYIAGKNEVYINVISTKERDLEGPLIVFDDTGILFKTHSLCRGSNMNRLKAEGKGDTPNGRATTSYNSERHIGELGYGSHGLIYLSGESGEFKIATKNGRSGIAIHCGHTTGFADYIDDRGKLMSTYGCIRVYNSEMEKLGKLYNELSKKGKKIYCYIEDYDGSINDVYDYYDMTPDNKDSKRKKRSKNQ
jgi:predicted chitinase